MAKEGIHKNTSMYLEISLRIFPNEELREKIKRELSGFDLNERIDRAGGSTSFCLRKDTRVEGDDDFAYITNFIREHFSLKST